MSIYEYLSQNGSFQAFLASVKIAGAEEVLAGAGPWTVFAPKDSVFRKLPQETIDYYLGSRHALVELISFHMLPGSLTSAEIKTIEPGEIRQGKKLALVRGRIMVNGVRTAEQDISCANGVIHAIDHLLVPQKVRVS